MNNFLDHLVTRAQNPAAGVQPRVPSLFEPPPAGALSLGPLGGSADGSSESAAPKIGSGPASDGRPEFADRLRQLEDILRAARADAPEPGVLSPPAILGSRSPHDDGPPNEFSSTQPAADFAGLIGEERNVAESRARRGSDIDSVPPMNAAPTSRPPKPASIEEPRRTSVPIPVASGIQVNKNQSVSNAKPTVARDSAPNRFAEEAKVFPPSRSALRPITTIGTNNTHQNTRSTQPLIPSLVRPSKRSSEPRVARSHNAQIAAPPTVVQVTIGRVEVRAANAAPARDRTLATAPAMMGLDEYLRRRTAGGPR